MPRYNLSAIAVEGDSRECLFIRLSAPAIPLDVWQGPFFNGASMRPEHREYLSQKEKARLLVWQDKARGCTNPAAVTLAVVLGGAAVACALWVVMQ